MWERFAKILLANFEIHSKKKVQRMSENKDITASKRKKRKEDPTDCNQINRRLARPRSLQPWHPVTGLFRTTLRHRWWMKILTIFPRVQNGAGWTVPLLLYEKIVYANPFLWTAWTVPKPCRMNGIVWKNRACETALKRPVQEKRSSQSRSRRYVLRSVHEV